MSSSKAPAISTRNFTLNQTGEQTKPGPRLLLYVLTGGAAYLLLSFIEWVDLNIVLSPVFDSASDRAALTAYLSLNILTGLLVGLVVGLAATVASLLRRPGERMLARFGLSRSLQKIASFCIVAVLGAIALNQLPRVNAYLIGLIREAEKFSALREYLLHHERSTSYLIALGLLVACSIVLIVTKAVGARGGWMRTLWVLALATTLAAGYYVDSRIEAQLYEYTLHYSMYLLSVTAALALMGTIGIASIGRRNSYRTGPRRWRPGIGIVALVLFIGTLAFTFSHFGKNQNLAHQVLFRSTQTKQHIKLARWALDFDRDGYSPYLGGGDPDDGRGDVNPGAVERVGDGIDNNGIGGDLSQEAMDTWRAERRHLNSYIDPSPRRLNVIFIFIDALRADHLGAYGYPRNTSPNIDKLAARSSVFENGYTPAPNTYEAFPKFMQSSYWDGHFETWSEVFARNGYEALLFPRRLSTQQRYVKGMHTVREAKVKKLHQTIDAAIRSFENIPKEKPFCAFLYATDPHRPYHAHNQFNFGDSNTDRYDGEIAFTDHQFGRLFDWLEQSGRLKDTMIVIMADHGESLGERGVFKHSSQLYNDQMRVPVIIHHPDLPGRRINDRVSTIDLGSTMLSAVGLEVPKEYMGVTLLPLMKGEPFSCLPIFGEQTTTQDTPYVRPEQNVHPGSKKYAVITQEGFKLIYNRNAHTFELFDLNNDPGELRNLYDRLPRKAQEMKEILGRFIDIVLASRPWDADESKYFYGQTENEDDEL